MIEVIDKIKNYLVKNLNKISNNVCIRNKKTSEYKNRQI